jgi:hypothetical protein
MRAPDNSPRFQDVGNAVGGFVDLPIGKIFIGQVVVDPFISNSVTQAKFAGFPDTQVGKIIAEIHFLHINFRIKP